MALNRHITLGALALLLSGGCQREQLDDCITSTGPMRTEHRGMEGFHTIDLRDRVDLVIDHRPGATIMVEAGRNLLDQVETGVEDSVLVIRNNNTCNWVRSFKPRITVHVPIQDVRTIILRGTGNVSATDTIRQEVFRIEQWEAMGTVELIVDVGQLFVGLHTGAGDVRLRGSVAHDASYYSGMLGSIHASEVRAGHVNVNNSGIVDIHCWAEVGLNAALYDLGDVYYRGSPAIDTTILGRGRLIRLDP